ncbi:MAG: PEP-CTERM sorting domain-containing protein [Planctomycetota bacterium]
MDIHLTAAVMLGRRGSVSQFVIVPEPGAIALAAVGVAVAAWSLRRRGADA